jgi:hypothetical protein
MTQFFYLIALMFCFFALGFCVFGVVEWHAAFRLRRLLGSSAYRSAVLGRKASAESMRQMIRRRANHQALSIRCTRAAAVALAACVFCGLIGWIAG